MTTATSTHGGQIICRRCGFTHDDGNYDTCPRWEPAGSRLQLAQERCREILADYHAAMCRDQAPPVTWYPDTLGKMAARLETLLDTL